MAFTLPDLPYSHDALAPHIDDQTMQIHHGKHHNAYITKLNNAIAEMIALTNTLTSAKVRSKKLLEQFVLVLAPFAPHICEELWQRLGHGETLAYEPWPTYDAEIAKDTEIEVPVQIKGKVRARIMLPADVDQKTMETAALADETIKKLLEGKTVRKVIVVPGKLVNIVAN